MAVQSLSGVGSIGFAFSSGVGSGGRSSSVVQHDLILTGMQGTEDPRSLDTAVEESAVQNTPGSSASSKSGPVSEVAKLLSSPLVANLFGSDVLPPGVIQPMFQYDVSMGELMQVGHDIALHATFVGLASKVSDSTQKAVTQLAQSSG